MENSFVYSKSISFLTGWTRSTQPDPYHKPAPPTLSLCTTARWAPRAIAAHRSASTSLCGWVRTSGEKIPNPPRPCPVPATSHQRRFRPSRRTKNLWMGHLGLPHPSLAAGLPFELVAHRRHAMATCAAGRCDRQLCHATAMPNAHRYTPTHTAWAACRLPRLGIVGLPLPLPPRARDAAPATATRC
jgi:hypothetical protein